MQRGDEVGLSEVRLGAASEIGEKVDFHLPTLSQEGFLLGYGRPKVVKGKARINNGRKMNLVKVRREKKEEEKGQ